MALDIKISFSWINYCRLCLQDKGLKIPIFEKEGVSENIAEKIKECLNITTYDGDPLPRMICHQCLCKLNTAFELHRKATESFRLLLTHLQPLKHVPSVHEYMKNCQVSLNNEESVEDSPADSNAKSPAGRKSGNVPGTPDHIVHQDHEENQDQVRGRVTRSRLSGRFIATPQDSSSHHTQKSSITIVPNIDNPSLTSSAKDMPSSSAGSAKDPVFLVPLPPKPRTQDNHFHPDYMDYDSNEEISKRKRKRITDHYDEALMDTGGNLVLAAGRTREWRHREGKRKKIGPASRTRAFATCLPGPSNWQCVLCSCYFASHNMLRRHLSSCLICQTCGLEFSSAKDKAVHEQDHIYVNLSRSVELLYKCDICERAFVAHLMLKVHMKYDHRENSVHSNADPNRPSPYVDPASPENMDIADGDSCKCDSDEENKSEEVNKVEERTVEGQEVCPKCSRPFATKQRLAYHLLGHNDLIKCSFCPWMFPLGPGRRRHQRQMHGDKADPVCFTCSVCKETFETKSVLYLHKKSHDKSDVQEDSSKGDTPSKKTELEHCHVCDKMIQPSKFMAHLLHHASDAYDGKPQPEGVANDTDPLECPICHVTSTTQEQHRAHIAQKHIQLQQLQLQQQQQKTSCFRCDGCNQAFANVEAINRHSCPGKETEKQWKNCRHCGQNLSDDIVHVCDNECPICHKIFKSARGQRLHIQHKHENSESFSGNADDQANGETRSSEGDSGVPEAGVFESVAVKEEKGDVEEMIEESVDIPESDTAELSTEQDPAERLSDTAEESLETLQQALDTAEPSTLAPKETPTTTLHAVSDEPSSSTSPSPSVGSFKENAPIKQYPAKTTLSLEKSTNAMGTPKIRLRPSGTLISDPPPLTILGNVPSATPKISGLVMKPPPPYRPPFKPPPVIAPVNTVGPEPQVTKSILIRRSSGPVESYSMVVTNVTGSPAHSISNPLPLSTAGNNVSRTGVDHCYTSNFANPNSLSNPPVLSRSVGAPVSSVGMAATYTTSVGSFIPITQSSQRISNNLIPRPNVPFSEPMTLNAPHPPVIMNPQSVICQTRPAILPQTPMIRTVQQPVNQSNSIRCVQISSLQGSSVSSGDAFPQMSSNQSNVGYGKLFIPSSPHPTVFNPLQPTSGAGASEENVLRDVLLGRRIREDFT